MKARDMRATQMAFSVCEKRCVAPKEVLREVRTKTPVGGMHPVTPQTTWLMVSPRISPVKLKFRSTRLLAIFAEMRVSRTDTMATLKAAINRGPTSASSGFNGCTNSGWSMPYLLFSVSRSKPRTSASANTPNGIDTIGKMTVQGIFGIRRIRMKSNGACIMNNINEGHLVAPSSLSDSMMFITNRACFLPGIKPQAKFNWFKPMIKATPTVKPSKTEVGMRSM
mmetsp:Transcript_67056/g.136576  ORF Transcript_67056/g.136576 Transcript_67056/m.136576 type:complete len:224 (+) Transcript_67056:766-1437(+)